MFVNFVCVTEPWLLRRFRILGLRMQSLLSMIILWRLRPWLLKAILMILCLSFFESDDSGSSIVWTEGSSEEE